MNRLRVTQRFTVELDAEYLRAIGVYVGWNSVIFVPSVPVLRHLVVTEIGGDVRLSPGAFASEIMNPATMDHKR